MHIFLKKSIDPVVSAVLSPSFCPEGGGHCSYYCGPDDLPKGSVGLATTPLLLGVYRTISLRSVAFRVLESGFF